MKVLICGDRYWSDIEYIRSVIQLMDTQDLTIISGGCRGVDKIAETIANEMDIKTLIFPAEWDKYGKATGPIRNKQMIVEGKPDLVLAFHKNIQNSKGTKNMITQAKQNGIEYKIYN